MFGVEDIFLTQSDNRRRRSLIIRVPGTMHSTRLARAGS